ncbi:MAG: hypothetical protein ABIK97_03515 [candidate division WOR-3 bacterium]
MFKKLLAVALITSCMFAQVVEKKDDTRNSKNPKTEEETSMGFKAGIGNGFCNVGVSYNDKGEISVSGGCGGIQGTVYGNHNNGNVGGCIGVGAEIRTVTGGVGGSVSVCVDKEEGLTRRITTSVGPIEFTNTLPVKIENVQYKPPTKETKSDWDYTIKK